MAPVTEKYGVPMVEANGAAASLFRKGYKYLFAVLSTTDQYLKSAVQLAAARSADPSKLKLAMAFENDPFSQDVREGVRSEEHTSELQSLMRISYAVFCLKKKIYTTTSKTTHT